MKNVGFNKIRHFYYAFDKNKKSESGKSDSDF